MTKETWLVMGVLVVIAAAFWIIEQRKFDAKEAALVALLAALAGLGRVPFAMIPGVQPTTFLVLISGVVFGGSVGLSVGVIATLISNAFLGHGPWTAFQMIAWGLCGLSGGIAARYISPDQRLLYSVIGFLLGFVFGWIMNIWHWVAFVEPLTLSTWVAVNVGSIWFDFNHAVGNAVLIFLFAPDAISILSRFKHRLESSYCQYSQGVKYCAIAGGDN